MGIREMKKWKGKVVFVFNSLGEYGNKSAHIELPTKILSKQMVSTYIPLLYKAYVATVTLLHSVGHQINV